MGNKRYPDIAQRDFATILRLLFGVRKPAREKGDHEFFVGEIRGAKRLVQNDKGRDPVFGWVIQRTIEACGVTREEFYGMLKSTARAANCPYLKDGLPVIPAATPVRRAESAADL